MTFDDAVDSALRALRGGILRLERGAWWARAQGGAQELPDAVVRRLRAERLVEPLPGGGPPPSFRLTARGERAAREAAAGRERDARAWERTGPLRRGPLATLRPADGAEDVDHVLILHLGAGAAERHRRRMRRARETAADPDGAFEFSQYRIDVWTVPIHDAAIRAGLLPGNDAPCRRLERGLPDPDALGARWCPDRGVNYGADTVTVFGGPGPEHPLTVSPAVPAARFEALLAGRDPERGPPRAIVAFERDEEGDWVARLACGHGRHVRDDPPWVERPWVRTEAGRRSRLGVELACARCADGEPPTDGGPAAPPDVPGRGAQ